ncbi:glutathione S-transferase [Hoeflea sp.]|uniref:glutathione S-transferase n=1 Tax=Hoeflea sp. TaxID=1940281 RepID=UPI0037493E73
MADYTLHYWPIQFRGQFIRAVLAYADASWNEVGFDDIIAQKSAEPSAQLIPHMGPPVLTDHSCDVCISQMGAVLTYLGGKHGLTADDLVHRAMTTKLIDDANDVLYEMTRHNGAQQWTSETWSEFQPRLQRWMEIFEETGRRHGLTAQSGFILGTETLCLADLVVATLWGTMTTKLPALRPMLETRAPAITGLCNRIAALPSQTALRKSSDASFGDAWCSGEIEASLRAVTGSNPVHQENRLPRYSW